MPKTTAAAMPRTLMPQLSQKSRVSTHFGVVLLEGELGDWDDVAMTFSPVLLCGLKAVGVDILKHL